MHRESERQRGRGGGSERHRQRARERERLHSQAYSAQHAPMFRHMYEHAKLNAAYVSATQLSSCTEKHTTDTRDQDKTRHSLSPPRGHSHVQPCTDWGARRLQSKSLVTEPCGCQRTLTKEKRKKTQGEKKEKKKEVAREGERRMPVNGERREHETARVALDERRRSPYAVHFLRLVY